MDMKVSVVTKFYEILRRKIFKKIYNCMHILFIFSRSLFVESVTYFCTQIINIPSQNF
jgi:hypothetical protein